MLDEKQSIKCSKNETKITLPNNTGTNHFTDICYMVLQNHQTE